MSLEELRALPWHEADSIVEQLTALAEREGDEETSELEATGENLTGLGFTYSKD